YATKWLKKEPKILYNFSPVFSAVSVICAEREYFYKPNLTTWDNARLQCQACYKDLTTITPLNAEVIGLNLTSDYWIGLRQNMSGSKFWSQWANGEPVLYQNWYPGHPVPKKKPEPQPTCPPPPAINNTKTEVMQCPAFMNLCDCLNSSSGYDDDFIWGPTEMFNTTPGKKWCPALAKLCDCLNSTEKNETSLTQSTTTLAPTTLPSTSTISPASTISSDLEPEYIEDSCVVLLSFGMWQEKRCNEFLPYICYDERFYGDVQIYVETQSSAVLTWSVAGVNISRYRIEINGNQTVNITNGTSYNITGLDPGELYRVQIIPVKCERDINAQNISFYTSPESVSNLQLITYNDSIIATWDRPNGNFAWFNVTISSSMSENISCPTNITTNLNYTFKSLQSAALYTVSVVTYVEKDLNPSTPANKSDYTKPNPPGTAKVENINSSAVRLSWEIPANSQGVKNINYSVKYVSNFWNDKGNLTKTDNTSVIISNLKSGSKYTYNITVLAGTLESLPSVTSGKTESVNRTLTITLLCSSSTHLYCMNNDTIQNVLAEMKNIIWKKFEDNIYWNLNLH
ncbi:hypothetical protein QTP70_026303, partial [Hemibagrus guttatus]